MRQPPLRRCSPRVIGLIRRRLAERGQLGSQPGTCLGIPFRGRILVHVLCSDAQQARS